MTNSLDLPDEARDDLLDAVRLDLTLAVSIARRDVLAAHGLHEQAAAWHDVAVVHADMRAERRQVAEEVEDAMFPSVDLGQLPD